MLLVLVCLVLYVGNLRKRLIGLETEVHAMAQAEAIVARAEGRRHLKSIPGSGATHLPRAEPRSGAIGATGGLDEHPSTPAVDVGEPGSPVAVSGLR